MVNGFSYIVTLLDRKVAIRSKVPHKYISNIKLNNRNRLNLRDYGIRNIFLNIFSIPLVINNKIGDTRDRIEWTTSITDVKIWSRTDHLLNKNEII